MADEVKPPETPAVETPATLSKAEVETMLQAQEARFVGMFSKMTEAITGAVNRPATAPVADAPKPPSFYENPEQAASALFDAKMDPYVKAFAGGEKERQLAEIAKMPHADKLMGEVKELIDRAPAHMQAAPGFARETFNLVVGRHIDDVRKWDAEAIARRPEFTESASSGAPATRKSEKLTADEMRAAEGMGITPDEYTKWRDKPAEMAATAGKRS